MHKSKHNARGKPYPPILGLEAFLEEHPILFKKYLVPFSRFVDKRLAFDDINRFIQTLDTSRSVTETFNEILKNFSLSSNALSAFSEALPETGSLIIVANHPTGLAETIILTHAILQKRTNLKILANHMLAKIPSLKPLVLPINVFNQSGLVNINSVKKAKLALSEECVLLVFPAAEIADYHIRPNTTRERKWSRLPVKLALETRTDIMQVHFDGRNSLSFYLMGLLHQNLRSLMIAKELVNKKHFCFEITTGQKIHLNQIPIHSQEKAAQLLYWINQSLAQRKKLNDRLRLPTAPTNLTPSPLASLPPETTVIADIQQLPTSDAIYHFRHITAYRCQSKQIPHLLPYLQIKREETFRQVGMGTNQASDAESYDEYATHLVLWDNAHHQLVGGYRYQSITSPDTISYLNGFYTIPWKSLLKQGDVMELSRSFVCLSHQKSFSSLLSLWRGLGRALFLAPKTYLVVGLVSIAHGRTSELLCDLIFEYIHHIKKPILKQLGNQHTLFQAKHPYRPKHALPGTLKKAVRCCENFSQLALLYQEISQTPFEFPELFGLYEKMGALPVGVSIDPDFADCIDVLQVWDMRNNIDDRLKFIFEKDQLAEMQVRYNDIQ